MNIALTKSGSTTCRSLVQTASVCSDNVICDKNEIWSRYKLQRAKLETLSTEKTEQLNMEFIQKDLEVVASEIQTLRKAINDLELSNSVVECKTADVRELSDVCKAKSSMSLDLSNLLQHQCNLKRQLEQTRKALRNVKIDNVIISEELNRIGTQCWADMSSQQDAYAQDRLYREQQSRKNAVVAREAAITSVANSITTHVLHKLQRPNSKHAVRTKSAKEKLDKYIQNAIIRARETAVVATTEYQLRCRRQVQNLLHLKRELEESKKSLAIKNEIKRSRDEDIASEKNHVKELLESEGANPYVAQYLLEIEEKHRELQRKMLAEEQKRLMDMQREYSVIEASKYKEEKERQKWDDYWEKRAKEKVDQKKKEEHEKYYEVDTDSEVEFTKPVNVKEGKGKRSVAYSDFDQHSVKSNGKRTSKARSEKSGKSGRVSRPDTGLDQDDLRSEGTSGTGKKRQGKPERKRPPVLSTRKAIHLEAEEKESLLNIADESTKTVLMDGGGNVFYFGDVNIGERKYVMVNVANIGTENVNLKMSPLNPYGSFTFCNSLKEIPPDNYYSLKYKFQPTELGESEEMIKIEEVGKRENFIIIKLKGQGISD